VEARSQAFWSRPRGPKNCWTAERQSAEADRNNAHGSAFEYGKAQLKASPDIGPRIALSSLGWGLRRSEVAPLTMRQIQQRDGRW
jgi:hypothetical protein